MNKRTKLGLLAVAVIAVAVVGALLINKATVHTSASGINAIVEETPTDFVPSTLVVKPGTTVTWKNTSDKPFRIVSTPYPQHTDLPDLDSVQNIGPGGTYQYTFTKKGTVGVVDFLNPQVQGKVIVRD